MSLPPDVGMVPDTLEPATNLEAAKAMDELLEALDLTLYAQIAERRSQLEDAETLRRVRAL